MPTMRQVATVLTDVFTSSPRDIDALVGAARDVLGKRPAWVRRLFERMLAAYAEDRWPSWLEVREFILHDERFQNAAQRWNSSSRLALPEFTTGVKFPAAQPPGN